MKPRLPIAFLLGILIGLPVSGADPYNRADYSWIGLRGTVTSVSPHSFKLDYGKGLVTVRLEDGNLDADAYKLLTGDEVTVHGRVDDDLFESTTITAARVHVKGFNTTLYGRATGDEDLPPSATVTEIEDDIQLTGIVSEINDRAFFIDSGTRKIRIDTLKLPDNPLDREGGERIEVGDRVRVTGNVDVDWWETRELMAESVVTLEDRS